MSLELKLEKRELSILWGGEPWKNVSKSLFYNALKQFPPDLSWEDFLSRFSQLEEKIGKGYALRLLSQRGFLSSELAAKLTAKGISSHAAKTAVSYCREKGFLDDAQEVARLVANERRKGQSAKAVFFKLRVKIDEALLRQHLQEASSDREVLEKWMQKNGKKIDREDPIGRKKWMAKLYRKGFSLELIQNLFGD